MPALLICSRSSQSPIQLIYGFRHFALCSQRLRLTFIRHERKPRVRVGTACSYGPLEKRQSLSISLCFIEAVAKHFKKSNLSTNIAAGLRRQKCIANHYRGASAIPFQKSDEPEFSFCPRFPLGFPQDLSDPFRFGPSSLGRYRINLQVGVSLCRKAPKSEPGIAPHYGN